MSRTMMLLTLTIAGIAMTYSAAVATTTPIYVVGNCKPGMPTYQSISTAVNNVPSGATVLVCPGTYAEQPVISQPLTLKGVTIGDAGAAVIVPPSGGLVVTVAGFCTQLGVENTAGPVVISDLVVDGMNVNPSCFVAGVAFQNASGTVDRLQVRNQSVYGIAIEGGSTAEAVTVQNSSIENFGLYGVNVDGCCGAAPVTANVAGNSIFASAGFRGIEFNGGAGSVSGNVISVPEMGMNLHDSSTASPISNNTFEGIPTAIFLGNSVNSTVTSNKFLNSSNTALDISGAHTVTVQSNQFVNAATAIDFGCNTTATVKSNSINGSSIGLKSVPTGVATPSNSFFNTPTLKTGC